MSVNTMTVDLPLHGSCGALVCSSRKEFRRSCAIIDSFRVLKGLLQKLRC